MLESWKAPSRECSILLEKGKVGTVTTQMELADSVEAPVEAGQKLGELKVLVDGEQVDAIDLVAADEVPRLGFGGAGPSRCQSGRWRWGRASPRR